MGSMHTLQAAVAGPSSESAVLAALAAANDYRAQIAMLELHVENLKRSNVSLRLEVDRLGAVERACNQEAAAWRWACGNETQQFAVCELDGTEYIPVTSSRYAINGIAAEIRRLNYGPQWTNAAVLAAMGA